MKTIISLAAVALLLAILVSGCTSQKEDNYGDIDATVSDMDSEPSSDIGLDTQLSEDDGYSSDISAGDFGGESEADSSLGLGGL